MLKVSHSFVALETDFLLSGSFFGFIQVFGCVDNPFPSPIQQQSKYGCTMVCSFFHPLKVIQLLSVGGSKKSNCYKHIPRGIGRNRRIHFCKIKNKSYIVDPMVNYGKPANYSQSAWTILHPHENGRVGPLAPHLHPYSTLSVLLRKPFQQVCGKISLQFRLEFT